MSLTAVAAVKNPNSLIFGSEKMSISSSYRKIVCEKLRKIHQVNDLIAFTRVGYAPDISDVVEDVRVKSKGKSVLEVATILQEAIVDKYNSDSNRDRFVAYFIESNDPSCTDPTNYKVNSSITYVVKGGIKHIKVEYTVGNETKTIDRDIVPGEVGWLTAGGYDDKKSKNPCPKRYSGNFSGTVDLLPGSWGMSLTGLVDTSNRLVGNNQNGNGFKFDWEKITQEQMIKFIEHLITISELMENMVTHDNSKIVGLNGKVEIATIDPHEGFQWVKTHDESWLLRLSRII